MAPLPDPVASDLKFPSKTDVVIIGGGIIGASTALELAERGNSVVLCVKKASSPVNSPAAIGAGVAKWDATRAKSRWLNYRSNSGAI